MNELKRSEEQQQKLKQICAFVDDIKNSIYTMRIADTKQEQFLKKNKEFKGRAIPSSLNIKQ